jgi:hypothetical protein
MRNQPLYRTASTEFLQIQHPIQRRYPFRDSAVSISEPIRFPVVSMLTQIAMSAVSIMPSCVEHAKQPIRFPSEN